MWPFVSGLCHWHHVSKACLCGVAHSFLCMWLSSIVLCRQCLLLDNTVMSVHAQICVDVCSQLFWSLCPGECFRSQDALIDLLTKSQTMVHSAPTLSQSFLQMMLCSHSQF